MVGGSGERGGARRKLGIAFAGAVPLAVSMRLARLIALKKATKGLSPRTEYVRRPEFQVFAAASLGNGISAVRHGGLRLSGEFVDRRH
jgi:hypothetical protein